jgi:hypothetical protein
MMLSPNISRGLLSTFLEGKRQPLNQGWGMTRSVRFHETRRDSAQSKTQAQSIYQGCGRDAFISLDMDLGALCFTSIMQEKGARALTIDTICMSIVKYGKIHTGTP